jgi:hypothetical protein
MELGPEHITARVHISCDHLTLIRQGVEIGPILLSNLCQTVRVRLVSEPRSKHREMPLSQIPPNHSVWSKQFVSGSPARVYISKI